MFLINERRERRKNLLVFFATLGVIFGLGWVSEVYQLFPHYDPVRYTAWTKVQPRLKRTGEETKKEAETSTEQVKTFFAERKQNARNFATEVLSWSGKWAYVTGYFYQGSHEQFLVESFQRNLFDSSELEALIEGVVSRYVSETQGRENQLLVAIRADLQGSELAGPDYLPALANELEFRRAYDAMLAEVYPVLMKDLGVTVTREIVSFVGSEIAAQVVIEIGVALAADLGISGGILGTGAYAGTMTFGVGLVAGILVDMTLDFVIRQAGYDPEGEIAAKVVATLDHLERVILEGDEKTREQYETAKWNSTWSFSSDSRQSASAVARSLESGRGLGLKHQLHHMNDVRSKLRDEAVKALILEGSVQ